MKKVLQILFLITLTVPVSVSSTFAGQGYTHTQYPIVMVGGVMNFDNLFGSVDYFHLVDFSIERSAWQGNPWTPWNWQWQKVYSIMLSPWMETEERGLDLAYKLEYLRNVLGVEKLNIIAHSHGTTTARVAASTSIMQGKIASLTTIAGPHFGTASADAESLAIFPTPLKGLVFWTLNKLGDFMATATSLSYFVNPPDGGAGIGDPADYVGLQNFAAVAKDFSQAEMEEFNSDAFYPSAGLPKGVTYGGQADNGGRPYYGQDYTQEGEPAGDGRGNAMDPADENAILYYSWTGQTDSPVTSIDIADTGMVLTWMLSQMYYHFGQLTEPSDNFSSTMKDYYDTAVACNADPNCSLIKDGFQTDAFIPVSSARFGTYISTFSPWNHLDEMNQTLGFISPNAPSPLAVFRTHANRLQRANR